MPNYKKRINKPLCFDDLVKQCMKELNMKEPILYIDDVGFALGTDDNYIYYEIDLINSYNHSGWSI
jgi:hypothetical protein